MKISYGEAREISDILKNQLENITEELAAITNCYNQINDGSGIWDGDVAANVSNEFQEISPHFPNFTNAIQTCKDNLDKIIANYEAADTSLNNFGGQ